LQRREGHVDAVDEGVGEEQEEELVVGETDTIVHPNNNISSCSITVTHPDNNISSCSITVTHPDNNISSCSITVTHPDNNISAPAAFHRV